jgi:hypothetical protein
VAATEHALAAGTPIAAPDWRLRLVAWTARMSPRIAALLGSVLAVGGAKAVDLPENKAEGVFHVYRGGGVTASGPALLVRKNLGDRWSLSGSYYVDMVTNASIDVVTTASPFKETRTAYELSATTAVRDSLLTISTASSREPDYIADAVSVDVSQEVYGGMTTITMGYTRANDQVGQRDRGFFDVARHWQYRLGVTQILSPRWLASLNFEQVSDDGFLGSPYRAARVFGATVPERNPRTRTSRAIKASTAYDLGERNAVRAEYRYFWDTWDIKAHTVQLAYSRYAGQRWLADGHARFYSQNAALFYSDNATTETLFVSRNRQLSTFTNLSIGGKLTYSYGRVGERFDVKVIGAYELMNLRFKDFTDLRTGSNYAYQAHVLQAFVSATF